MLFKNSNELNKMVQCFEIDGFGLYSFKNIGHSSATLQAEGGRERIVLSLKGRTTINGSTLEEKDMAYVPIGQKIDISWDSDSVTFVAAAPATSHNSFYIKKYKDSERKQIGKETFRRTVIVSIGENDKADRLIAGYVEDSLGEWSSYPPHKHDDKPEAYIFYGINPGFAVQLVMDEEQERAYVVHDYDIVYIPRGYHPHVNTSLTGSSYAWIICAPPTSRNLNVMIHPAFKNVDAGKTHYKPMG